VTKLRKGDFFACKAIVFSITFRKKSKKSQPFRITALKLIKKAGRNGVAEGHRCRCKSTTVPSFMIRNPGSADGDFLVNIDVMGMLRAAMGRDCFGRARALACYVFLVGEVFFLS
jgi:hypothetical protein